LKNYAYDKSFFVRFFERKHFVEHNGYASYKNTGKRKYKKEFSVKTLGKRVKREQQIEPKQELHRKG